MYSQSKVQTPYVSGDGTKIVKYDSELKIIN